MKNYRIVLELVETTKLTDMQKKINQWMTVGLLRKFETQVVGNNILFKIILHKEPTA